MAEILKDSLYKNRRNFLRASGMMLASGILAACTREYKIITGSIMVENGTSRWVAKNFDPYILWALAENYGVPVEAEASELYIKLLSDANFGEKNDLLSFLDENGRGVIKIATGVYEEEIKTASGHPPEGPQDETWVSIRTSEAILCGYCQIASYRKLIPVDRPIQIAKDYLDSILNRGENERLIIFMNLSGSPQTPSGQPT